MIPKTPSTDNKGNVNKEKTSPTLSTGSAAVMATTARASSAAESAAEWGDIEGFEDDPLAGRLVEDLEGHRYVSEEGLDKDLERVDLLQERKFIDLSEDGRAYWIETPNHSDFHVRATRAIAREVGSFSREGNKLDVTEEPVVWWSDKSTKRYPDVAVYGKSRLDEDGVPAVVDVPNPAQPSEPFKYEVNPSVVIEYIWANTPENEVRKLNEQMTRHSTELGIINCAVLIKTISSKGNEYPTKDHRADPTLIGFDVYVVDAGHTLDDAALASPTMTYRHGTTQDEVIVVNASRLGEASGGFQIRMSEIKKDLIKLGVAFVPPSAD